MWSLLLKSTFCVKPWLYTLQKTFVLQGRTGPAFTTPLYTIRTTSCLCQRLYKAAFATAVVM
jgi:hypothetical protein